MGRQLPTPRAAAVGSTRDSLFSFVCPGDKTLAECFNIFALIHQITTDHDVITRIAREVSMTPCPTAHNS